MGIKNVNDVAARAMSAQIVRMNAIASNLANANNVSGNKDDVYQPLRPVFKTIYSDKLKQTGLSTVDAIRVEIPPFTHKLLNFSLARFGW